MALADRSHLPSGPIDRIGVRTRRGEIYRLYKPMQSFEGDRTKYLKVGIDQTGLKMRAVEIDARIETKCFRKVSDTF